MNIDIRKVASWLNLTPQQFDILLCIYHLQEFGGDTSPKAIQKQYKEHTGKYIMKPNLFNILRLLKRSGCIKHKVVAGYTIDLTGIKQILQLRREEYQENLKEFDNSMGIVEDFFLKVSDNMKPPEVEYFSSDASFIESVTREMKKAKRYYITAKFPGIAYTYGPYASIRRGEYVRTLWRKCCEEKSMEVNYLTCLNPDYPYTHAYNFYKDPKKALNECKIILNQLENQIELYDNLKIYYIDNPYGLDIILNEDKYNQPEDLFMFIRDTQFNATGGIHIKSKEIGRQVRDMFQTLCKQAILLEGVVGKKIIAAKRKELKSRFGVF
jgi:hypothetical protein